MSDSRAAPAHMTELATRGLLTYPRRCKNRPLYRVTDLHALAADPLAPAQLTEITSGRQPATGQPPRGTRDD
jgi:hypothetical protein